MTAPATEPVTAPPAPPTPPAAAVAPTAPPEPPAAEPGPALTASAGDGFTLSSADGDFQLHLYGYLFVDSRFYFDDDDELGVDGLLLRSARPSVEGELFGFVGFRLMPDFSSGQAVIQDGYAELAPLDALRVRVGKFKAPIGMERLQGETDTLFIERGLPTALVPNRDVSLMVHGALFSKRLGYAVAIENGVADGASGDLDAGDAKDFAGRLWTRPFRGSGISALDALEVGAAAGVGRQDGDETATGLAQYRTGGQLAFFKFRSGDAIEDTVVADGRRWRFATGAHWSFDRFGLWGEYVRSAQRVRLDDAHRVLAQQAWQVGVSALVTHDAASWEGVEPSAPIDLAARGIGAIEIVGRVGQLDVDDDAFPTFANADAAASRATEVAFGVNWYLNQLFALSVDFGRTAFEGGAADDGDRPAELALLARAELQY